MNWKLFFLRQRKWSLLVWSRYKDDVFFIWTHGQQIRDSFLEELNRCNYYVKITYESSKKSIPFLDLKVSFPLNYTSNPQIDTSFYITHRLILIILNAPLFTVRSWELVGYALKNLTFLNILGVWNLGLKEGVTLTS